MRRLEGRIALVTGAARGIGLAIARGFAAEGARIVVTDIDEKGAAAAAGGLAGEGAQANAFALDVADLAACATFAERIGGEIGQVSILVNNAGVIFSGRIDAPEAPANWAKTIDVNVGGAFNMCRSFYPHLKATKGAVINLASIRSFVAAGNAAAYAASKGAVMQFTKALAVEWGREGIRVNAIAPGFIETSLVPEAEKTPQREASILSRTPMHRVGEADEVAGAAVFLASDDARYVTGAIVPVDGGYLAG